MEKGHPGWPQGLAHLSCLFVRREKTAQYDGAEQSWTSTWASCLLGQCPSGIPSSQTLMNPQNHPPQQVHQRQLRLEQEGQERPLGKELMGVGSDR